MKPPTVFLGEMTNPEVEAFLKTGHTVIIPTGATEQHGRHLPVCTDWVLPQRILGEAGRRRDLIVGPTWLLPTLIVALLVPTVVTHRAGKRSLNRALGIIINGITTLALIGSVILLVRSLPSHRETPMKLLLSGGLLWLTNVIVFALWYWRLDGGGPTVRHEEKKFGSTSFLFPQMQVPRDERVQFACAHWRPRFLDYLFVAFTHSSTFGPTDAPLLARWAKVLDRRIRKQYAKTLWQL